MQMLMPGVFVASGPIERRDAPTPVRRFHAPRSAALDRPPRRPALPAAAARFCETERRQLLMAKGIGERMVDLLEASGFASLDDLERRGAVGVADDVASVTGSEAWRCRVRCLERMLGECGPGSPGRHGALAPHDIV